jgi:hypothetical protein
MITDSPWDYNLDHDLPESSVTGDRNHLRIRARIPESPVRPRPDQRSAPGVGLRRRKSCPFGWHRPTAGRRPPQAEFMRHPPRQASASANAKDTLPVGAGRPPAEGLPRPNSFGAQADHRPKAPTGRIHSAPSAPGVGLRQRKRHPPGRRRPTIGRRPPRRLKSAFRGACAPGVGLRRRKRHLPGRHRPTIGRRHPQAEFIRHTWPTVGHRPPQGEFLRRASPARRRAGRPWRGV